VEVLVTPVQAPNANAYAERWVRTVRAECLDWLLIVGRSHLEQVLRVYARHYNTHRPHRALALRPPDPPARLTTLGEEDRGAVRRRDLLGGLLHEYHELDERLYAPFGLPERLREPFMGSLVAQAAGDDPPFVVDYWRQNLRGRRRMAGPRRRAADEVK